MVGSLDSEMILESKNLTAFQLGFRIHSFSASSARYVAVGMFCFFFSLSLSLSPVFFDQRFIPSYRSVWLTLQVSAGDGSFSTIQPLFCWGTGEPASKTRTRGVVSVELRLQNHIHQEKNAFVSLLNHPSMDSFHRKCLCKNFTKRSQPRCLHVGEPLGVWRMPEIPLRLANAVIQRL